MRRQVIVGALRVKNETRWIERAVRSLEPLCDEVHILDDHSTDETPDICKKLGAKVTLSPFSGLDEVRDKNYLLDQISKVSPDWVVMIDGDEVLVPGSAELIKEDMRGEISLSLRILFLWDREDQIRTDKLYRDYFRPSAFLFGPGRFLPSGYGRNFHCSNVPQPLGVRAKRSRGALLHYGYLHAEDRVRKYRFYRTEDPEGEYDHIVVGDVFPAETECKLAGPLELEPL